MEQNNNIEIRKRSRLSVKVALILSIVAIVAIGMIGYLNMTKARDLILKNLQSELQIAANTLAYIIDGDEYETLTGQETVGTPEYNRVKETINNFVKANRYLGYDSDNVYTFSRTSNDDLVFTVMLHDQYVGNTYQIRSEMLPTLNHGQPSYTGIYKDESGTWVSAYAPILNSSDKVVGLIEVDFNDHVYLVAVKHEVINIILFCLLGVLVAILVSIMLSRYITKPIANISEAAVKLSEGDFSVSVPETSNDEIGMLSRTFNFMVREVDSQKKEVENALEKLQKAQEQMIIQEKMASMGTLSAGIAHKIKNPLNFVNNFAKLSTGLLDELEEIVESEKPNMTEDSREDLDDIIHTLAGNISKIEEHGERADHIIQSMSQHSQGRTGEFHLVDLNEVLNDFITLSYKGFRAQDPTIQIAIERDFDSSIGEVAIVPQNISRVIINLVNNGCYEVNRKKKELGDGFTPTINIRTVNHDDNVEISVRDNGDGMPEDVIKQIFNPFFTTKPAGKGTGLGLSMSYDIIVGEHNGELDVQSKPGEFTEFKITIPKKPKGV